MHTSDRKALTREILLGFWKAHILHHAADNPAVGQWILSELRHHGYELSPGTLYPLLKRMTRCGWLRCEVDAAAGLRAKRHYFLTKRGRAVLAELREKIVELHDEVVGEASGANGGTRRRAGPAGAANARSRRRINMSRTAGALLTAASLAVSSVCAAQPAPLTLPRAVQLSVENYPSLKASAEQAAAASQAIGAARAAYLPRLDVLAQFNRATRNNVFGLVLPQAVIPSISGPVLPEPDGATVWGSAVGLLVNWEVFDFGLRHSNVAAAEAARLRADAAADRARLDVAASAADAFLTLLAAEQTARAARAAVERAAAVQGVAQALVAADLRPGADWQRALAESALAEGQLVQAEAAIAQARASLAALTGVPSNSLSLQPGPLLELPPGISPASAPGTEHPAVREQAAARSEVESRATALGRSYAPRIMIQGAAFARGTGARTDGTTGAGSDGLAPDVSNWSVGLTISFAILEAPGLHARREAERHRGLAESARYEQVVLDLGAQQEKAKATLTAARALVTTAATRVEAARAAEQQARARYRAGLSSIVEVADAQRLLTLAESDDALATLNVWRAELNWSYAGGDMAPFLREAGG